ncbi:unnamed protein product [Meloidogyne enterolobii]|uniref:Uncharacterized protein n=1 Tax=Meloidogyne enterolobii TaxID=390850 RepID=A0ACB0ZSL4_MELEN
MAVKAVPQEMGHSLRIPLMTFRIHFWNLRLSHLFAFSSLEVFILFWVIIDFYLSGSPESISRIPKEDFEHCSLELDFVKIQDDTSIFSKEFLVFF